MGDDLDELLDEAEWKFCSASLTAPPMASEGTTHTRQIPTLSDLDRIIHDICEDDPSANEDLLRSGTEIQARPSHQSSQKRCYPLLLGGSATTLGHSNGATPRACGCLRCTSCDFHVVSFDDYVWHSRSDYLFFRNNVPDFERLRRNLVRKRGFRAYACQCSWESVEGIVDLASQPRLKWVCGRH